MKVIVAYLSLTGNTKKVAEAIFDEIQEEKEIKVLGDVQTLKGYDLAFVGFPIHREGPPDNVKSFLERHAKDKKLALFITHAMPPGMEMLEGVLAKCKESTTEANLIGIFDCQGELDENIAQKLLKSPDPQMQMFGTMRALNHPDTTEIEDARMFANEIIGKAR